MGKANMIIKNKSLAGFINAYGGLISVIIIMMIITTIIRPSFFTSSNIVQLLVNNNSIFLTGLGMTFVILSGSIDLSQGALAAFATMIFALLVRLQIPFPIAVILTCAAGGLIGILNGTIVSKANVHSFVVTLGMTTVLRGLAVAVNGGYPIPIDISNGWVSFSNGRVLAIPNVLILCAVVFIISFIILKRTNIGRNIYAVGGNQEAAKFSGIDIVKTTVFAFCMSGIFTALAGSILAARMISGLPSSCVGLETSAVTAVIIGGTSFTGGDGSVVGTVFGCILMAILNNAMVMLGIPDWMQSVMSGAIIIISVIYDRLRNKTA